MHVVLSLGVAFALGVVMACGPAGAPAAEDVATSLSPAMKGGDTKLPSSGAPKVVAKAQPDECFYGVGDTNNGPIPAGGCLAGGQKKVNQAYVWGLALSNANLWFGTAPNVHCLVLGGYLGLTDPIATDSYVCEFGSSHIAAGYGLPPEIGDWRPPQIFRYDLSKTSRPLTEMTASVYAAGGPAALLFNTTMGLRSAGTLGDVVFLGGPGLLGGVNLFAFDTATNTFLGAYNFAEYSNIRKWLVVNNVLYAGVATTSGEGRILRWGGTPSGYTNLWDFTEVARVGSDAAELVYHTADDRIFVATWPGEGTAAGVYMSPPIPTGGFTAADIDTLWSRVWDANDYEPDPVTAATYGGGALASFGGYLYWGTMHVPFLASEAHFSVYGPYYDLVNGGGDITNEQLAAGLAGTQRAIAIFRGRNFTSSPELQVLYGESILPAFSTASGWTLQSTMMGAPLFGSSGFGNYFNNYTWAMAVFNDRLFVGTMDWSYLAAGLLQAYAESSGQSLPIEFPKGTFGADLWSFKSTTEAATAISEDGLGNYSSYGIRTTVSTADALFLGMANPMNLMTSTTDKLPEGGWELIRLK